MTQAEALRKARSLAKRWGAASKDLAIAYVKTTRPYFVVGFVGNRRGEGDSWEAAFADADRRSNAEQK